MNSNKELMIFNVNLRSFCDWGTQTSTWKLLRNSKPRLHDGCARHTSPSQTVLCSQTQKNKSIGTCSSELYTFYLLKLPPPPRAAICNINDQKLHLVISSLYPSNINQTAPRKKQTPLPSMGSESIDRLPPGLEGGYIHSGLGQRTCQNSLLLSELSNVKSSCNQHLFFCQTNTAMQELQLNQNHGILCDLGVSLYHDSKTWTQKHLGVLHWTKDEPSLGQPHTPAMPCKPASYRRWNKVCQYSLSQPL